MRNPEFEIGTNTTVTVYTGEQKFNNSFGTANQTGGWGVLRKGCASQIWRGAATPSAFYLNGGPRPEQSILVRPSFQHREHGIRMTSSNITSCSRSTA